MARVPSLMKLRTFLSQTALAAAFSLTLASSAGATVVERVVAVVGENPILLSELRREARPFLAQIHARTHDKAHRAAAESEMYRRTLQRMIDQRLIAKAAVKHHVRVTDEEVDHAIERLARIQKISVQDLMREVLRSGMTGQAYRKEIRSQLLEGKMLEMRVKGQVRVTDDDMRQAYEQMRQAERARLPYRARWIVLHLGANASSAQIASKERAARAIERELRNGQDFASLARRVSNDASSKASGGDLGRHRPGDLAVAIEKRLIELEPGQITAPFRYEDALVIVKLQSRDKSEIPPYDQARERLAQRVYSQKLAKARQRWLNKLRRGVHVEVRL